MMELDNSKVFHEPYLQPFYYGPERQSERFKHVSVDEKKTYNATGKPLLNEYDGIDLVFSKDMAYFVYNHFDELLRDGLRNFQHTFLIRNPSKTIQSLYAASMNTQLTGWDYFDPEEDAGFKELLELYSFIVANKDDNPVVVDADDLLEDPEGIMRAYCEGTSVKFNRRMLEWEAQHVPEWKTCGGWHVNAISSSGFHRKDPRNRKIKEDKEAEEERLPDIIMQTIEESMPYYNELYKKRIKPISEVE